MTRRTVRALRSGHAEESAFALVSASTLLYDPGTTTPNTTGITATRDFSSLSQARDEVVVARILQGSTSVVPTRAE